MATQELTSERSLNELADSINQAHNDTLGSLVNALQYAIKAGEALLEARSRFEVDKGWTAWCEANVDMSRTTAGNYMRIAYYKEHLPRELIEAPYKPHQSGRNAALQYLRGLPSINLTRGRKSTFDYTEATRLVEAGVPKKEVGRMLGVAPGTIRRATMSAADRRRFDARKTRMKKERDAAVKRDRDNRIARQKGGDLSHAYSHLRKALDTAQAAHDASHGAQRKSIASAMSRMYQATDYLVKAMKDPDQK